MNPVALVYADRFVHGCLFALCAFCAFSLLNLLLCLAHCELAD